MTDLTNLDPGYAYPDYLTTTNNGHGLSTTLNPLQDGLGNNSTVTIATNAINFNRTAGNTFQLDGVALTASASAINNTCGGSTVFIANVLAPPATPVGGGVMYVEAGALKYKGSAGTVTVLAPA